MIREKIAKPIEIVLMSDDDVDFLNRYIQNDLNVPISIITCAYYPCVAVIDLTDGFNIKFEYFDAEAEN